MQRRNSCERSGFSLVELMIALSIALAIFGLLSAFQLRTQDSYRQTSAQSRVDSAARNATTRILDELSGIARALLVPDPSSALGSDTLTFQRPSAVSNTGAVTWSTQTRLALLMDDRETDNGVDDDGDGLVDERRLVLTREANTANPEPVTLCHGVPELYPGETENGVDDNGNGVVDERGFSVRRIGDLLCVRLAVQLVMSNGGTVTATVDTAVILHN